VKCERQHAGHGVVGAIDHDVLSDNARNPAKPALVDPLAEDHYPIPPRLGFLGGEGAAQHAAHTQNIEKAGRHARAIDLFRLRAAAQIEAAVTKEGQAGEDVVLIAPLDKVLEARLHALGHQAIQRRIGFPNHHQALRIAIRHGMQQHGIEDRKDGGIGADAQRQGDGRGQGESGIL